jgi:hypothetical protein
MMKTENELNIFKTPNLDVLKSMYSKSKAFVSDKINWENEAALISKTFRILNKNHRTKRTLAKIGQELRIFTTPSIEQLNELYIKTSIYLEVSKQQTEQPDLI